MPDPSVGDPPVRRGSPRPLGIRPSARPSGIRPSVGCSSVRRASGDGDPSVRRGSVRLSRIRRHSKSAVQRGPTSSSGYYVALRPRQPKLDSYWVSWRMCSNGSTQSAILAMVATLREGRVGSILGHRRDLRGNRALQGITQQQRLRLI